MLQSPKGQKRIDTSLISIFMLLLKDKGNIIVAESHYLKSASKLEGKNPSTNIAF